jgi:hypothetical protein
VFREQALKRREIAGADRLDESDGHWIIIG